MSNTKGASKMHVPFSEIPTSASLNCQGFRGYEGELVDCQSIPIDDFCEENDIHEVNVVKIDVEGFEGNVLEGMKSVLSKYRPKLFVEINPDGPYQRIGEILSDLQYSYFWLTNRGPIRMGEIRPDESEKYRNYLCI